MTNKTRVLFLLRYLKENSDEGKAVSNAEIREVFRQKGERVSLPTIRSDISSLREAGYDISVREVNGIGTYYKFLDRDWTAPELQILIDAVAAGQFLSEDKSEKLISRLRSLAGPTEREDLNPGIRVSDRVKAPNEQILYIIQAIKEAIARDSQIRFKHYEYNAEKKRVPKHDGETYVVSPYAMIWKKDRYYLIGWSEKHGKVTHFRIDRMGLPKITGKPRQPAPEEMRLEDRTDRIFSMFDGPEETVTLRFAPAILNQIIDQFGEGVGIMPAAPEAGQEAGLLETTVTVHLSPTFYGWLFQYAGEMTVTAPEYVCEQYRARMRQALDDLPGE